MKTYLNRITGVDDTLVSLLMSKRSWTREKEIRIRKMVKENLTEEGFLNSPTSKFLKEVDKIIKYGVDSGHTTILRFIDLSFTVEGLHRGAQDDFDSHAKRLDNRIVRSSTRLATFEEGELSDYYKDKIKLPSEIMKVLSIELPEEVEIDSETYVKTRFGHINKKYIGTDEENDVTRGLYVLGISSNFVFKSQYPEFAHIVQHRDIDSHANPELKQMIEMAKQQLTEKFEPLGKQLKRIKMQK